MENEINAVEDDFLDFDGEPKAPSNQETEKTEEQTQVEKIEEVIKKDDEPQFVREPKKQKATEKESIGILRKQRDEYNEKLKSYRETLGDIDPKSVKPIVDFIFEKSESGIIDEGTISEVISSIKTKDEEIESLRLQLSEKEKVVNDLDIRYSDSFKSKYQKPYEDSAKAVLIEFASVTPDKKIIAPNATKELHDYLLQNADSIDPMDVKSKMVEFARKFKEESGGEDVSLPSLSSIMSSIREFAKSKSDLKDAYENWSIKKKQTEEERKTQQSRELEENTKRNKKERSALAAKAFREYNLDDYDFLEEKDVKDLFSDEYKTFEKIYDGQQDAPSYDKLITRGVNARLWEKHVDNYKRLIDLERSLQESERNGIKGSEDPKIKAFAKSDDDGFLDF